MKELKTKLNKREAFSSATLNLREAGEGEEPKIAGVAIVTEAETVLYECEDWREVEVISPNAIRQEVIDASDIKLNLLHERNQTIARCNKGQGGLKLETREDGLHFETAIPDCDLGKRALALIGNGTYTGCSFEFYPKDYEVSERVGADGKTEYLIRHNEFAAITAITIGMDPAYQQTSVGLREIYREIIDGDGEDTEEVAKREEELKEKAASELRRQQQLAQVKQLKRNINF